MKPPPPLPGTPNRPPPPLSVPPPPSAPSTAWEWPGPLKIRFAGETEPVLGRAWRVGNELFVERSERPGSISFPEQFLWGTVVVLVGRNGEVASLPLTPPMTATSLLGIGLHERPLRQGPRAVFGVLQRVGAEVRPVRLVCSGQGVQLEGEAERPFQASDQLTVEHAGAGVCRVEIRWEGNEPSKPLAVLAPERLAYALWEEWDVQRTQFGVEKHDLNQLYQLYNEARRYSLLAVLFSDILLLHHELNRGTSMEEMADRVEGGSQSGQVPDSVLREIVVAKTLTLTLALPRVKQKFEMLASMYPYYWVHHEAEWLKAVFGRRVTGTYLAGIRKKAVPTLRQQVRSVQANIRTPLGEIENAARAIDGLLSREEIAKSTTAKASRYAPAALQGASLLFMIPTLAAGAAFPPMAIGSMASFLGSGVIGNVTRNLLEDRQAAMQIQRAAESIFPWWNVFMKTLVVSVFEANQFIDELTLQTNKRDRELFDKIPATEQPQVREHLAAVLRRRIVEEKRNRFAELLEGSGVRLHRVIDDIELIISREMKAGVDEFVQGLQVGRTRSHPPEALPPFTR